jgi:hypothetical protein
LTSTSDVWRQPGLLQNLQDELATGRATDHDSRVRLQHAPKQALVLRRLSEELALGPGMGQTEPRALLAHQHELQEHELQESHEHDLQDL